MDEQRLQPLLELAGQRVSQAAGGIQHRRTESMNEQARLDELRRYLHDYETQGAQPSRWQLANQSAFISRLRQAIDQQVQTVGRTEQAVREAVEQWSTERLDQRRYETLQTQARSRHTARLAKHEQRELDELAARQLSLHP